MSTKNDYTPDQWKAIAAAPVLAGLYITISDASGLVGITKEAMAVGQAITGAAEASASELVKSLGESVKTAGGRPELPEIPRKNPAETKAAILKQLQEARAAVASKSAAEAEEYSKWVLSVAKSVAEASKEGGFLGFGGTKVSAEEEAGLRELSAGLGVTA
jgi:hypothetical protein